MTEIRIEDMYRVYSVNVISEETDREFTRTFTNKYAAELYILKTNTEVEGFHVTEYDFVQGYTTDELKTIRNRFETEWEAAKEAQKKSRRRTDQNYGDPIKFPCETCGKGHLNYVCCEACNLNSHICQFCGDFLGHSEDSACYRMMGWEEF